MAHDLLTQRSGGWPLTVFLTPEDLVLKYYVWDKSEVKALLTPDEYSIVENHYGLNQPPNFEHHWHFYIEQPMTSSRILDSAKAKLLAAREKRYLNAAEKTLHAAWPVLTQYPQEHCELLLALQEYLSP